MTRRTIAERLVSLEAVRGAYRGPDVDLLAHLPAWWRHLTDDELEGIARMESFRPGAPLPDDPDECREYQAIAAAAGARARA